MAEKEGRAIRAFPPDIHSEFMRGTKGKKEKPPLNISRINKSIGICPKKGAKINPPEIIPNLFYKHQHIV